MLFNLCMHGIKFFILKVGFIRPLFPVMVLAIIITHGPGIIFFLIAVKRGLEMESINGKK